ncbi:MAG: hypothetical protein F4Y07_09980 [Gemmatimonadetes bacterium]|nr:hypothetical protein [Gemmatimonadota bacterium]MXV95525.1 hypothetical protein [Gemmatimonadota bacterium]MYB05643.1 hypothetical protein [Gemmatimonadota bacterium]MYE16792.1 hypothetical protein [Gemmatimonadota bacterium]MYG24253.1 hypothetical protein [Gemmatimonadota bacterium]
MIRGARFALLASAALTLACQEPPQPLLGEWVSVGSARPAMTYIFEGDGRSTWILDLPQGPDTVVIDYRVDYARTPIHLNVGPWSTGPVAGQTLFGIVELLGPDRFRVDFEPGDPDTGAMERPGEFSSQTVTFVRMRN